jgi:hypothetical protein
MGKFGRGLGKEFAWAILNGEVSKVFSTAELKKFVENKGWNPSEKYVNVLLPNSSSLTHSKTYPPYFKSIGNGKYVLADNIRRLLQE